MFLKGTITLFILFGLTVPSGFDLSLNCPRHGWNDTCQIFTCNCYVGNGANVVPKISILNDHGLKIREEQSTGWSRLRLCVPWGTWAIIQCRISDTSTSITEQVLSISPTTAVTSMTPTFSSAGSGNSSNNESGRSSNSSNNESGRSSNSSNNESGSGNWSQNEPEFIGIIVGVISTVFLLLIVGVCAIYHFVFKGSIHNRGTDGITLPEGGEEKLEDRVKDSTESEVADQVKNSTESALQQVSDPQVQDTELATTRRRMLPKSASHRSLPDRPTSHDRSTLPDCTAVFLNEEYPVQCERDDGLQLNFVAAENNESSVESSNQESSQILFPRSRSFPKLRKDDIVLYMKPSSTVPLDENNSLHYNIAKESHLRQDGEVSFC